MDPFEDNLSQMPAVLRYNYTPIQQELENYVNESIEVWCDSKLVKFFHFLIWKKVFESRLWTNQLIHSSLNYGDGVFVRC